MVVNHTFVPADAVRAGGQVRSRSTGYFAAAAIRGQSAICRRATSTYLPFSGRKIDASPSFTSNQSLPSASRMFGL